MKMPETTFKKFNEINEKVFQIELVCGLVEDHPHELNETEVSSLATLVKKIANDARGYMSEIIHQKTHPIHNTTDLIKSNLSNSEVIDSPTIGARIRQLRKDRMLTQADIAESVNVSTQAICLWENDNATMSVDKLIPLANALKCDPIWLLTGNPVDVKPAPPAPVNVMKGADLANIGVRIESRRDKMGMSLNKLAEEIDTSGAMIREWETGKAIPHSDYIDKLAKALNTTVTWLMTGKHITA